MTVAAGTEAPDFTLKDQDGNEVTLSSFRGNSNVVLVFYPFTFTGVCQGELCALRDDVSEFETANAQLIAISCDSRFSQQQWAQQQAYTFPVLSDFWPHGAVSRAYGVFNEQLGAANRATFVIDKDGKVVGHVRVAEPRHTTREGGIRSRAREALTRLQRVAQPHDASTVDTPPHPLPALVAGDEPGIGENLGVVRDRRL